MDARIFQLREKMSANLSQNWTLEKMAEAIGVSKSHLQKIFKTETGKTLYAFLHDERLEKARELLEGDWEQIGQIGLKIGMPHESHFTRDFKKKYGLTPTAYRKQYHENIQAEMQFGQK